MKKWLLILFVSVFITGCGSQEEAVDTTSSKLTESGNVTKKKSTKKKPEFRVEQFQVEGTEYQIKLPKTWERSSSEETNLNVGNKEKTEIFDLFGMKKIDFESMSVFSQVIKESIQSEEQEADGGPLKIEKGSIKEAPYETTRYQGEVYSFDTLNEGMRGTLQYYFLETETDFFGINIVSSSSFFKENQEMITEILNSIEPIVVESEGI